MNSWKKFIIGEPMPDKNDPKYKERYEREVAAGKKFADKTGISWLAGKLQVWGYTHQKIFLCIVFGVVFLLFVINIARLVSAYQQGMHVASPTAVERVDSALYKSHRISK